VDTRSTTLAFSAYVALAASSWMLQLAYPTSIGDREAEILVLLLALGAALLSGPRLVWYRGVGRWRTVASGLLLFGLPTLLADCSQGISTLVRVSLLALVPAFVVVVSPAFRGDGDDFLGLLGSSLVGLAGALLLLPADPALLFDKPVSALLLVGAVGSIAVGSCLGHKAMRESPLRRSLILMLGPSLLVLGLVAAVTHPAVLVPRGGDFLALVWGAVEVWLLMYLLRAVPPIPLSTRYLLVPLVTALEGVAFVRPRIGWRLMLGAALLLFGSVKLIMQEPQEDSPLSLL